MLGAGESGTGAALLAKAKGYDVFVSDNGAIATKFKEQLQEAGIRFEENQHSLDTILASHTVVKSPGIPDKVEVVGKLKTKGVEVIDEVEFASRFTEAKFIAITGTNGKTTTTLLTYHLLKSAGLNVGLAGNVGQSLAKQVIKDSFDFYVLELSSFQLDGLTTFHPHISILLNITPDHMDRYDYSLQKYCDSKFRITHNLTAENHFINFSDNALIKEGIAQREFTATMHGVSLQDQDCTAYLNGEVMYFEDGLEISQGETVLRGPHNAINMMSAITAARILGVSEKDIRDGLKTFKNAAHRLEYVATINDVSFINDSKATNVDSVKYALESFSEPLVWIAGGIDKGNDYDLIMESVNEKVKALVCLGKDNSKLREAFHKEIINLLETDNMKTAVRSAMDYAQANDVVLLSPACSSFDLFKNYEDRGNQFKDAVIELKKEFENKSSNQ
ncbi:UDP-N-acetylmuramoyl-L-alanine--D-glutamate ligase [Fulvivirga aurantia]|uniref:UDP-N-acetylmuramoyl-L-alanine--D-glutamate ligase n=1 Tax=Fulvivirga aurantia TaxID=2529383 RepID=UPI0031B6225E